MLAKDKEDFVQRIGNVLLDEEFWDFLLGVNEEVFEAHRVVCATALRSSIRGPRSRCGESEDLSRDDPLGGFDKLRLYIFTGRHLDNELSISTIWRDLKDVTCSDFRDLRLGIGRYLEGNLWKGNVCLIYDRACLFKLRHLSETCLHLMDEYPYEILKDRRSYDLPAEPLYRVLSRDSFCVKEIEIFKAVQRWNTVRKRSPKDIERVLEAVRLTLIPVEDLEKTVKSSRLVPLSRLLDVFEEQETNPGGLKYRAGLVLEKNLSTAENGVLYFTEDVHEDPVTSEGWSSNQNQVEIPLLFRLTERRLLIRLKKPSIINHLIFQFFEEETFACSYYIEVSANFVSWDRVVDYSEYPCHSCQNLFFEPRAAQFIRITITNESKKDATAVSRVGVHYIEKAPEVRNGICVPKMNVASSKKWATVIEGSDRYKSYALISGQPVEEGSGMSRLEQGVGTIMVRLPQPYIIDSMRMFIYDRDSQKFSYYIETSVDKKNWIRVADRTDGHYQGWQILTFEALPVIFIKIQVTASIGEEKVFRVGHLECPAQVRSLDECPGWTDGVMHSRVK